MSWTSQVFAYCERGQDPSFWAEPLNAVTNGAFIVAALAAWVAFAQQDASQRSPVVAALIGVVFVIGIGSFLFHTFATRWAALADVLPITIFMLAYLGFTLRVYLKLNWLATLGGVAVFYASLQYAGSIPCRPGLLTVTEAARGRCLNGTAGYVPAFLAMLGIGAVLWIKRRPAAIYLLLAAGVFLVSMLLRTVDIELCDVTRLGGHAIGTHFLWHVLNAVTLYLLLLGAVRHGSRQSE